MKSISLIAVLLIMGGCAVTPPAPPSCEDSDAPWRPANSNPATQDMQSKNVEHDSQQEVE